MMISDLPRDLVEDILYRVPLISTRAVRLTCKKWETLWKSGTFTKLRIGKLTAEREESTMIVLMDDNLYLVDVVVNENPSKEIKGKLTFLNDSEQIKISEIFNCEGLLLCILHDIARVVVWNPYLGQTRSIRLRYYFHDSLGRNEYRYALGYENKKNKTSPSYKILRFIDDYYGNSSNYYSGTHFLWYEIYDFDSGLWKTLDITSPHWYIAACDLGVTVIGNTYWIAGEENSYERLNDYIICFDFTRERFGSLLPLPFQNFYGECIVLSCVKDEKLAVLCHKTSSKLEIWITSKIETENLSWSKFLTVDVNIPRLMSFCIDEEKTVAKVFYRFDQRYKVNIIGEDGYFRELDLGECKVNWSWGQYGACSYIPNSVQIMEQGGKGKKENSLLEKCRYDQKMLRLGEIDKSRPRITFLRFCKA